MWNRRTAFPVNRPARDWDAVLLDNYPDHPLAADEDLALERYVFAGGGLIFIAGDSNAKLPEDPKTPFEKMLPVRAEPPPEKPTAVVLVLDKSGSMSGPKIEMARDAARASIRTLRPIDMIGVISFDETFNWVIPMGPAGSLEDKSNLIAQITANGGTKIYQAVEAGVRGHRGTEGHAQAHHPADGRRVDSRHAGGFSEDSSATRWPSTSPSPPSAWATTSIAICSMSLRTGPGENPTLSKIPIRSRKSSMRK